MRNFSQVVGFSSPAIGIVPIWLIVMTTLR
jgi:hypothetical protein